MENLYIWFITNVRIPKGVPNFEDKWLRENFLPNKSQESMNYTWLDFNFRKDQFPPLDSELKFPDELYFIVQKQKELLLDFLYYSDNIFIVSEDFLDFLNEQKLNSIYELSKLKVVHKNEKDLKVEKKYYAIRIGKFDDELFDFNVETKKRAAGMRDYFLYPNLNLKDNSIDRKVFFLSELCYRGTIIVTETAKNIIKQNFYSPEIYKIEDFPLAYNNQFKLELLPEMQ